MKPFAWRLSSPTLDGGTLDLDGAPAASADQVVVVVVGAPAVHRLAVVGAEDVDLAASASDCSVR